MQAAVFHVPNFVQALCWTIRERGGWWRVWAWRWKWFGSGIHDGRQWCVRWAAASTPKIQVIQRTGQRLSILQGWSCAEDSTFTRAPFRKRWRSCVCYLHRASVYEEGSPLRCESLLHGAGQLKRVTARPSSLLCLSCWAGRILQLHCCTIVCFGRFCTPWPARGSI